MQETQKALGEFLSQEDPLEKEVATRSSILAWKIPQTEGQGGYNLWCHKESDTTEYTHTHKCVCPYCSVLP